MIRPDGLRLSDVILTATAFVSVMSSLTYRLGLVAHLVGDAIEAAVKAVEPAQTAQPKPAGGDARPVSNDADLARLQTVATALTALPTS